MFKETCNVWHESKQKIEIPETFIEHAEHRDYEHHGDQPREKVEKRINDIEE